MNSVSRVTVRHMFLIGVTQRSISSTATVIFDGSSTSNRRWSGCKRSCSTPPLMTLRDGVRAERGVALHCLHRLQPLLLGGIAALRADHVVRPLEQIAAILRF